MFEFGSIVCSNLAEAIPKVLRFVKENSKPVYVRGELNSEVLGVDIILRNPCDRLPIVAGRRQNVAFCVVEFLHYCAQRSDLSSLEIYAPNIRSFYGGLARTTGSNYGRQIFGKKRGGSQWEKLIELLSVDPGTKRAFLDVYVADEVESLLPNNGDVACTTGFQILIRDDKLNWVTSMRANDAYRGFVSDIFSFTLFQELLAATMEMEVGEYLHRPTSLHIFPEDEAAVDRILNKSYMAELDNVPLMPPLSPGGFWSHLKDFWKIHDGCRISGNWESLAEFGDIEDSWWVWVSSTLYDFHQLKSDD